jgi:hypothetical protein
VTTPRTIPLSAIVSILYAALTIVGLYLFRGIPVVNIALGFPIGAWIAWRADARRLRLVDQPGTIGAETLRTLLGWGLGLAAVTVAACWIEVAAALFAARLPGILGAIASNLPFPVYGSQTSSRATVFAIAAAPAVQVLTTVFGGVLVLAVHRDR